MSSATVTRPYQQQHTRLPNVVQRQAPKKDFTYTFQRVAPLLFVFLLSLSVYTKYKMSHVVVPPQTAVQSFTPTPWEKAASIPHVDIDFGEQKWEELKRSLSNTEDNIKGTVEDEVDASQGTLEDLKIYGREKWESIKSGKDAIEDNWAQMNEKLSANKDAILNKWKGLKEDGKTRVQEGINKVNEMTPDVDTLKTKSQEVLNEGKAKVVEASEAGKNKIAEAVEVGKEKLAEASAKTNELWEQGKEKLVDASHLGKEKLVHAAEISKEKMTAASEIGKEKLAEAIETTKGWVKENMPSMQEKAEQVQGKAAELGLGVMGSTKEWVKQNMPAVHEKAEQFVQAASEGIERVLEGGPVLQSPAYGPALPPNMCSAMSNRSCVMPW